MSKIPFIFDAAQPTLAVCLTLEGAERALKGEKLWPWDIAGMMMLSGETPEAFAARLPQYVALDFVKIPSFSTRDILTQTVLCQLSAQREALDKQYFAARKGLTDRENDLRMLGYEAQEVGKDVTADDLP